MYTKELGSGSTVIFVHGTTPADSVRPLAEALADEFRVLVVDLPGYGKSPLRDNFTAELVGDELRELIDEQHAPVCLVGHSAGSYHVLNATLGSSQTIEKAALLGPFIHATAASSEQDAQFAGALRAGHDLSEPAMDVLVGEKLRRENPGFVGRIAKWLDEDREAIATALDANAELPDIRPELERVDVPVYIRVGEDDKSTPPESARAIHQLLPDSRLDIVPQIGHLPAWEDRDATAKALIEFFG
jgi:pimeloyl-ACP methyl ester carboxylesterase